MANYGQFIDYAPHPELPGAYNFNTANGPYTFAGPEAEQLKARLDAAKSAQMVAGDNAAPGPPPGPVSPATADPNAFAKSVADNAAAFAASHPDQVPAAAPTGDRPVTLNEINTGIKLDAQGRPYKEVAGTRGTSKADLENRAANGVATPTAESQSVSGAHTTNQDYLDARATESQDQQMAANKQRDAELQAENAGRQVAEQQFVAATAQQQQHQQMVNDVQAQVQQAQMTRDQALKDYTGTKIDPSRIFHGEGGMGRRLAAALASGIGAYGAAMNHTQNFAGQTVDAMIGRDIAAQEADLRTKKDASDTALGDLVRRGMSLDQAKGTLRTIQNSWAQQQLALAKGSSASDQINAHYDTLISQMQQANDTEAEKYRQNAEGTATKTVQAQILHPVAGSSGGRVYLTPEQATKLAGEKTSLEGGVASTAKAINDVETAAGAKAKGDPKALAALATADLAAKSLAKYKDDEIPQTLENQGAIDQFLHKAKDKAFGAGASARDMSERDRALIQDTEAARGYVRSLSSVLSGQGALSKDEMLIANSGMAPGATVGELRRSVAMLAERAKAVRDSGGSPGTAAPPAGAPQ